MLLDQCRCTQPGMCWLGFRCRFSSRGRFRQIRDAAVVRNRYRTPPWILCTTKVECAQDSWNFVRVDGIAREWHQMVAKGERYCLYDKQVWVQIPGHAKRRVWRNPWSCGVLGLGPTCVAGHTFGLDVGWVMGAYR